MSYQNTTLFLLDNVDSFTYNLVDELSVLGLTLKVYRNTVPAQHIIQQIEQTQGQVNDIAFAGPWNTLQGRFNAELLTMQLVNTQYSVFAWGIRPSLSITVVVWVAVVKWCMVNPRRLSTVAIVCFPSYPIHSPWLGITANGDKVPRVLKYSPITKPYLWQYTTPTIRY